MKSYDYRAVVVPNSSVLRGLFVSVQIFFIDIFRYLSCFNLFETNVTQLIKPMNYVYHSDRLITPRSHYARELILRTAFSVWNRIQCFPSTIHRRNFKKPTSIGHFGLLLEQNPSREITWLSYCHCFKNLCFERFIYTCTCANAYYSYFPISQLFYSVWN